MFHAVTVEKRFYAFSDGRVAPKAYIYIYIYIYARGRRFTEGSLSRIL